MALEGETVKLWERLLKLFDKYGYWKIFKSVVFVGIAVAFIFFMKNLGENFSFEKQQEAISYAMEENSNKLNKEHDEKMKQRRRIKPYIMKLLETTLNETESGRAFVIELHNGSSNTAGLPFVHGSMTYEVVAHGIDPVDEDYQNISLTRYSFAEYLHQHGLWYGNIEEFTRIDPKLGKRIGNNGGKYIVVTTIKSDTNEIGYFGFIYYDSMNHSYGKETMELMLHAVQKLSKWLDKDSNMENIYAYETIYTKNN